MRRFFVRPDDIGTQELRLRGDEADHLVRVLRLGPGAQVIVFDGSGHEYVTVVEGLDTGGVVLEFFLTLHRKPLHPPLLS